MISMRKGHSKSKGWYGWRQGSIIPAYSQPPVDSSLSGEKDELNILRRRVWILHQRMERIKQKIAVQKLVKSQNALAIVDEDECTGCGFCYEVCPTGAISLNRIAQVDSSKCIACLSCVNRCPQGAIAVKYPDG